MSLKADLKGASESRPSQAQAPGQSRRPTTPRAKSYMERHRVRPERERHGCAFPWSCRAGQEWGVMVPAPAVRPAPFEGSATLTDDQPEPSWPADLLQYPTRLRTRTAKVRGQVVKGSKPQCQCWPPTLGACSMPDGRLGVPSSYLGWPHVRQRRAVPAQVPSTSLT